METELQHPDTTPDLPSAEMEIELHRLCEASHVSAPDSWREDAAAQVERELDALRSCKNIEQMTLIGDPAVFAFHAGWMDSLVEAA